MWNRVQPVLPGFYWVRNVEDNLKPIVVQLRDEDGDGRLWISDLFEKRVATVGWIYESSQDWEWVGPLEPPA